MQFFLNREGNISVFRVGILIGVIGVLAIVAGFVFFQIELEQRRSPFNVELYDGAEELDGRRTEANRRRTLWYVTDAELGDVLRFYQAEMDSHTGEDPRDPDREQCVRVPEQGDFIDYQPGAGNIPYYYDCTFDNSYLGNTQVTYVRVQPGVRYDAPDGVDGSFNFEGQTMIVYNQTWSP